MLKYLNEYWCYSSGLWRDGRCFGVLHSRDLINWREQGGVLEPPDPNATCYWAPEVHYENGVFYLYYSVGNEERMRIGVACAEHPAGPFRDCGVRLTAEDFAIDPHVFKDDDGRRWMFYATDFPAHTHVGTGTVCDRMLDPFTLAGDPRPVTRGRYEWQVSDPQRLEKGGARWHTVEGPFVLKRKGLYYQMFSGGNWRNENYGVGYAVSRRIDPPYEWRQPADGELVLPVLRTLPGRVIGPGHNSVVRGPDNQQLFCIYHSRHRWSRRAEPVEDRALSIDRQEWSGERMLVLGPSFTPQPEPNRATFADNFDLDRDEGLGSGWVCRGGRWSARGGVARQEEAEGEAAAQCAVESPYFVAEVGLRIRQSALTGDDGGAGIKLVGEQGSVLFWTLIPQAGQVALTVQSSVRWEHRNMLLPAGFDFTAFHQLRVEVNARQVRILVDGTALKWEVTVGSPPSAIALITNQTTAEFAGFALTQGWEDLFATVRSDPAEWNWKTTLNDDRWRIDDWHLWYAGLRGESSILTKGPVPQEYELVINAKLIGDPAPGEGYGFLPALGPDGESPLLTVARQGAGWALCCETPDGRESFPLPPDFDHTIFQQFRFRRRQGRLTIQHEARILGEIASPGPATMIGLYGSRAIAAFDLVRLTALT